MLKIYGIPNCDTIKKTLTWLKNNGLEYEFHDYKKMGISSQILSNWLSQRPESELINRKGTTWRALTDEQKNSIIDNDSAIALMTEKPSIIKRPVITQNDKIVAVGFDSTIYEKTFLK